jgi:hypothetical protein
VCIGLVSTSMSVKIVMASSLLLPQAYSSAVKSVQTLGLDASPKIAHR